MVCCAIVPVDGLTDLSSRSHESHPAGTVQVVRIGLRRHCTSKSADARAGLRLLRVERRCWKSYEGSQSLPTLRQAHGQNMSLLLRRALLLKVSLANFVRKEQVGCSGQEVG